MKKVILFGSGLISILFATTINIPSDYTTIQAGINASVDGDTVLVAQGTYSENLILANEIVLASHAIYDDLGSEWLDNDNINNTIISGAHNGSCLIVRDGNINPTITGFTFQDGVGTQMLVTSCNISRRERSGGAILLYKAYPTIMYNRFINNGFTPGLTGGGDAAANGGAISHFSDDDVEFDEDRDQASENNHSSRDIPEELNIQNNYFEGNSSGDGENFYSFGYEGSINVSHSVFEDIDCESNSVNEFVLKSLEDEADYIQNEISGVCIESNSFYVSASNGSDNNAGTETSPLKTIGHALTLVKDDGTVTTINLNAGVYSPSSNDEKFPIVLPDNVHLIGDDRETTILDAEANANKEAAVIIINEVENVTVANLTLTGGYSEGHGCTGGGALLVTANDTENLDWEMETNLAVLDNLIIENSHAHNGGGLSLFRVDGPTVSNLIVRNNTASLMGGGIFVYVADVTMSGIEIYDNYCIGAYADDCGNDCGHGGGLFLNQSWGTYDEMNIHDNTASMNGGGVWSSFGSAWTMTNSTVSNNVAPYNGGGFGFWDHNGEGLNATLINVTVENNVAQQGWGGGHGGGVWANNSSTVFEDCSFINNVSNNNGGAVNYWGGSSSPVFKNTIFDGNSATSYGGAIYIAEDAGGFHVEYCTFVDNSASINGGAIQVSRNGDVINSTFSGNSTGEYGAISIGQPYAYVNIYNSILWNDNITNELGGYVGGFNIMHTDIQESGNTQYDGYWIGNGNIVDDPLFTDANNGDYTLQEGSPCIDAGTADLNGDGIDDITDYNDLAPDMGAYEFQNIIAGPTGFQYFLQSASVMLWWNPSTVENLAYYFLERSTDSLFNPMAGTVVTSQIIDTYYTDEDLEFNTQYFYRISSFYGEGLALTQSEYSETISVILENLDISHDNMPISYKVHQNHPNPFNPVTTIRYDLPEDGLVNITIYDMMGRQISTLVSGQQTAGYNKVQWNATNAFGEAVSAGLYLYTIHAGEFTQTRKMVLLK